MFDVVQIPMRTDNYSYGLIKNNQVIIIDPSESAGSEKFFAANPKLSCVAILCTHSHFDHTGGNQILQKRWSCPIYGPELEHKRITGLTHKLAPGQEISLLDIKIKSHDVRAHTCGHMAFEAKNFIGKIIKYQSGGEYIQANISGQNKIIFVGDSLFAAGCGRLFEGTAQDLVRVLKFFSHLPKNILIACAHEYTQKNLEFALSIFPHNKKIQERIINTQILLEREGSSVPSILQEELETNPFLLALDSQYHDYLIYKLALKNNSLTSMISALRKAKDNF